MSSNKLAENNMNTQLSLQGDIIRQYEYLMMGFKQVGDEMRSLLQQGSRSKSNDAACTHTFTSDQINELWRLAEAVAFNHGKLNSICQHSESEIRTKQNILNMLQGIKS